MNYLFGASGHGLVVLDILHRLQWPVQAFIDDADKPGNTWGGLPVIKRSQLMLSADDQCLVAVGINATRQKITHSLLFKHYITAIHPGAIIADSARVGEGTAIMAGAIVNPAVTIGRHAIINTGATVDHECQLADFVHISPNATLCGEVKVGEASWVGAGAVVLPGVTIGKGCTVGAGAVVIRSVADGQTVVGNPARILPPKVK